MGKSARIIGWEDFGLTAAKLNALLKQYGYLYGEPGAYGLTEKGKQFAETKYHSNGVGGYSHYQVNYETRTWSDKLAGALKADMAAGNIVTPAAPKTPTITPSVTPTPSVNAIQSPVDAKTAAVIAGVAAVGIAVVVAAPYAKKLVVEKVVPGAKNIARKLKRDDSEEAVEALSEEVEEEQPEG